MAAKLPDVNTLIQAGIDPKTGLPIKLGSMVKSNLKPNLRRLIGLIDRSDALKRYQWFNLPSTLDGNMIERLLYYKGQGAFFFMSTNKTFYFLPYALDGNIDVYGRFLRITPLPFGGTASTNEGDKIKPWIDGLNFEPIYEVVLPEEWNPNLVDTKCVLLRDYSNGLSQEITPRSTVQDCLIDLESEMLPFMRTGLMGLAGVAGIRVPSEDAQSNVKAASASVEHAALTGDKWIPIVDSIEFQSLDTSNVANVQEFLLAMQSVDNLRLSALGLTNGGLFEKQGTILQSESDMASANVGLVLQDGLELRQNFCNLVNSLYGLNIWCEIAQPTTLPAAQDMGADETGNNYQGEEHIAGGDTNE